MKKVAYLLTMVFVLTFAFTSCEKDDNDDPIVPTEKTLEELYPEWSNLKSVTTAYPQLSITITDNVVKVDVILYNERIGEAASYYKFDKITTSGNSITFNNVVADKGQTCKEMKGTFVENGSQQITSFTVPVSSNGFDGNGHLYVFQ